jgi:hypothetical protein
LTNHAQQLVATDFFVVPTATCRLLFVLVLLAHDLRRVVHVAVTNIPRLRGPRNSFGTHFPGTSCLAISFAIGIMRSIT